MHFSRFDLRRLLIFLAWLVLGSAIVNGKVRIVTFGDSTTAPREGVLVYSTGIAERLCAADKKVEVINAGVPSNTTIHAVSRLEKDVLARQPDIVVIQFGINDAAVDVWKDPPVTTSRVSEARYVENLRYILDRLRTAGAHPILMTPNSKRWTARMLEKYGHPPYDISSPAGYNLFLKRYAQHVRVVAADEGCPLVDVYAAFENLESAGNGTRVDELLLDGIHPNSRGHQLISDMLSEVILENWESWFGIEEPATKD